MVILSPVNTPAAWSERAQTEKTPWGAAGWSERGQHARFQAALTAVRAKPGESLLDFGCGTGYMATFISKDVKYLGVDWADGMLDRARREHPDREFSPHVPDQMFDYVAAIGVFNLPGVDALRTVDELWDCCRQSMVVSLYRGDDPRCVKYLPQGVVGWPRLLGARRWSLDCSYLDNDMLLVMHRHGGS